jgi:S1-C subfamily serine protease
MGADAPASAAGSVRAVEGGADDEEEGPDLDLPLGSPLHPDDRLWRHPSELASAGLPSAGHPVVPSPATGPPIWPQPDPERRPNRGLLGLWLPVVLAGTVGALLSAGLLTVTDGFNRAADDVAKAAATSSTVALAITGRPAPALADMAERLQPSLVAVAATGSDGRVSRGSAIAIRSDHVVTAARVVAAFHDVRVLVGGVGRKATVVGTDLDTDLAVLSVEDGGLVPLSWGDTTALRPGDQAVAVSTAPAAEPGPTVTAGVVSGIARTLAYAGGELRGLLQVDRPVPPEAAGGALLDPDGSLIGITLPAATTATSFGYAVPAEIASEVARQLLLRGRVVHPWLGVDGTDRVMNGGAEVQRVKPASPAAEAGLQAGDVIIAVDGVVIPSMGRLLLELRRHQPGFTVRLAVQRAGNELALLVTLGERPTQA